MSIYTKSKTAFASNNDFNNDFDYEGSFKVGIARGADDLVIDYLTNLYANPAVAVCRELFTNAADASSDVESPVYIKLVKQDDGSECYTLTITDYGCGMSSEQLKNNYVTYANSSKANDYGVVGAFGLGSKSPMAISNTYKVVSNNGEEQNEVIVSRTPNGVFANISACEEKKDYSFTEVAVSNIRKYDARKMIDFIDSNIAVFSKKPVNVITDFTSETRKINLYEKISISIPEYPYAEVSMYYINTSAAKTKIFNYLTGAAKLNTYARINDIAYCVSHESDTDDVLLVVDVEPGYFAFAPSREELPHGDKLDHVKDIFKAVVNNFASCDETVSFLTKNKLFDDKSVAMVISAYYHSIDSMDCFANMSDEDKSYFEELYKAIKFIKSDDDFKFLGSNTDLIQFTRFDVSSFGTKYEVRPAEDNSTVNFTSLIRNAVRCNFTKVRDYYIKHMFGRVDVFDDSKTVDNNNQHAYVTYLVEDAKRTKRSANLIVPSRFKKTNMKNYILEHVVGTRYTYNRNMSMITNPTVLVGYLNKGATYNHSAIFDFLSLKTDRTTDTSKVVAPEVFNYNDLFTKEKTDKPAKKRTSLKDREVTYHIIDKDSYKTKFPDAPKVALVSDNIEDGCDYVCFDDVYNLNALMFMAKENDFKILVVGTNLKSVRNYYSSILEEISFAAKNPTFSSCGEVELSSKLFRNEEFFKKYFVDKLANYDFITECVKARFELSRQDNVFSVQVMFDRSPLVTNSRLLLDSIKFGQAPANNFGYFLAANAIYHKSYGDITKYTCFDNVKLNDFIDYTNPGLSANSIERALSLKGDNYYVNADIKNMSMYVIESVVDYEKLYELNKTNHIRKYVAEKIANISAAHRDVVMAVFSKQEKLTFHRNNVCTDIQCADKLVLAKFRALNDECTKDILGDITNLTKILDKRDTPYYSDYKDILNAGSKSNKLTEIQEAIFKTFDARMKTLESSITEIVNKIA